VVDNKTILDKLLCKYCSDGARVRLIRNGTVFYCPNCDTYYSNCPEIIEQLKQAYKKHLKNIQNEFQK